ncbi:MAG: glycosyltransferase family 2 protein [Treponema sp.]|nr:glycosyltransferase family 2 protein [Treponema sp.]
MKDIISIYKNKRSYFSKRTEKIFEIINENKLDEKKISKNNNTFSIAICIPVRNEYPDFFSTLKSIKKSVELINNDMLIYVICMINSSEDSSIDEIYNNKQIILKIYEDKNNYPFNIIIIENKFSKNDGVGLARKIAMDFALEINCDILACLDADTLVEKNYLTEIINFAKYVTQKNTPQFALTNFSHQFAKNNEEQKAINFYESYLHEHSLKLKECGTPFYHIALGPTIITTAKNYCVCGGMNEKLAGEDFYFLQALIKNSIQSGLDFSNCALLLDTIVKPSSRISKRVLFGTGTKIESIVNGEKDACEKYTDECYIILKNIFLILDKSLKTKSPYDYFSQELYKQKNIYDFFVQDNFFDKWKKICNCFSNDFKKLKVAFHVYFDGLKIIRLFHYIMKN